MLVERAEPSPTAPRFSRDELRHLLTVTGPEQEELFRAAREARQRAGADEVKLRGVIELTNYCQKTCDYCAIRAGNKDITRYRMNADVIMAVAETIRDAGIGTVFLQGGQDPKTDKLISDVIPRIRRELDCEVLLCMGEKPRAIYEEWAALGATSYILKFETSSPALYDEIVRTSLAKRIDCIRWIKQTGMEVGTGNIVGLPNQTMDVLIDDVLLAEELQPDFVSASPFIPNEGTPLETIDEGNVDVTLNTMAIYRLLFPKALVPTVSALERLRGGGQLAGLQAGANVITVNFTPKDFRDQYAIYSAKTRFVVNGGHATKIIEDAGLRIRPAHP
ncbi:MAG: [FeFe] hydrogenase H-cluster radical SAM maturase HydE [Acetobacteraceae bacterium]